MFLTVLTPVMLRDAVVQEAGQLVWAIKGFILPGWSVNVTKTTKLLTPPGTSRLALCLVGIHLLCTHPVPLSILALSLALLFSFIDGRHLSLLM